MLHVIRCSMLSILIGSLRVFIMGISNLATSTYVTMVPSTTEDCQITRGRLASLFVPSTTQDLNNYSSSSNSVDLSEPQRRRLKRRTLMPRFICNARENSLNSTVSADSNEALNLPWSGWRRRRSSSKGSYELIHESHELLIIWQKHPVRKKFPNANSSCPCCVELAFVNKKNARGEKAPQYSSMMKDPPDFSEYNQRDPVFGAALEDQISSPDFPNVPLVLQATIAALESRGLHFTGLYRAPGRQSEIDRFVCASNLSVLNPHYMLSLPTWNDIKALTGVIKVFLRRLPEPICDPSSWAQLADTLPEKTEGMNKSSLFAALKSIRSNLIKDRSTSSKKWQWRFATLDFLFTHLRRIVALEKVNYCSSKCIAICFGPCLFNADLRSQAKFNVLLELMLQHWPWLKAELDKEFPSHSQHIGAYIEDFLENGPDFSQDFNAYASLKYARSTEEVLDIVKRILESAQQNEVGQ
uniref:Rho-GAP domain-containing protein n=1 Tax=Rodentolepis nana TaxID=102285 RepID=A0A0R3TY87_RODNA